MKKYYHAYDDRYKAIHKNGYSWSSDKPTPIVLQTINKYKIGKNDKLLELGCGEGRDAIALLNQGYKLIATDVSEEAISYCQSKFNKYSTSFHQLDFIEDVHAFSYDFIYAIAVLHMLVLDEDRKAFYQFIHNHLNNNGVALITSMGDGVTTIESDINKAFDITKREHFSGEVEVTTTSCRMVNFCTFKKEAIENDFVILEEGITSAIPEFDKLMYLVIKKA